MSKTDDNTLVDHPDDLARTAIGRSSLYGFLASIFRQELDGVTLTEIRSPEFREVFSEFDVELDETFLDEPAESLLESLTVEYAALFLGPGGHISPHESVQRGNGSLWGPKTDAVKAYIQAAGFRYEEQEQGMPDHISMELEFMGQLVGEEAKAWIDGDSEKARNALEFQKDFLGKHLGSWAGNFFNEVKNRTEVLFYREIAGLAADFIATEKKEIETRLGV